MIKSNDVGTTLKMVRALRRVTQKGLAELIGVNQGYISGIELGKRPLPMRYALKLANVLKINFIVTPQGYTFEENEDERVDSKKLEAD